MRIGSRASDETVKFNNLLCHFTVENLREAFRALDGRKAAGADGKTKLEYGKNLDENLKQLMQRIHGGTYRPLPRRGIQIPKANGKLRSIAISAFEDKLVEWVTAKILSLVYEPLFIETSYGFRPARSAHQAIAETYKNLKDGKRPFVVEIDLKSFFDTVPQRKLMRLVRMRITDRRFRSLIARFLQAGVLRDGELTVSETGTAQGAIMSPILANVYLHYCLDKWFVENHSRRDAVIIRYADDAIFLFRDEVRAKAFQEALKANLEKHGLCLNEEKSGIVNFRKLKGNIFHFLGFTFRWGHDNRDKAKRLKVTTEKKRLHKAIQAFADWIQRIRSSLVLDDIWKLAAAKLRGHYNYYGVHTNRTALYRFYHAAIQSLFKWLNRRSQRKSFSWERYSKRLMYTPLPTPPPVAALKTLDLSSFRRLYA